MGKQRHRVDAVRQRAHVRTSRARGERARLERVRHVADEDGDRRRWQHLSVEELGREPENGATERVDQQQLNEIVEGEAEEPVDVAADDPTHTAHPTSSRAYSADERRDRRIAAQRLEIVRRGKLRAIACGVHHAQKAERRVLARAELVPRQRRDVHEVVLAHVVHAVSNQHPPRPALDHHRVGMLVPLQGGVSARLHLEVAELAGERRVLEQHLARDVAERRGALGLVAHLLHAGPAAVVRLRSNRLDRHGCPPAATAATKPRARCSTSSATSSEPPMSSIASRP